MDKRSSSTRGFGLKDWTLAAGHGLAHLQHATDRFARWGFLQLRRARAPSAPPPVPHGKMSNFLRGAGRGVSAGLRTIGLFGEAYYERYEALKRKEEE